MAICSYLVIPAAGRAPALARRLEALPGCDVVPAENRDLLLLVTETADDAADETLRATVEAMDDVRALILTFGALPAETAP